jgi:hypothetical protein
MTTDGWVTASSVRQAHATAGLPTVGTDDEEEEEEEAGTEAEAE